MFENIFIFLGNWWAFATLLSLASLFFGYLIPKFKTKVFIHAAPGLPHKILDEYFWTWTPDIALKLLEGIGAEGRLAYRKYYLHLDFWFPVLTASLANTSLLLIALGPQSKFAWVSLFAMLGFVFDLAENINHFRMSKAYPSVSSFSLKFGPLFTFTKWIFAIVPMFAAVIIFAVRAFD